MKRYTPHTKRYTPRIIPAVTADTYTEMCEDPEGQWVMYEDVEKLSQDTDRDIQLIKANTREQLAGGLSKDEQRCVQIVSSWMGRWGGDLLPPFREISTLLAIAKKMEGESCE